MHGLYCLYTMLSSEVYSPECGQETDIPDEQLMKALQNIQRNLITFIDCKDAYISARMVSTTSVVYTINPDNQISFQVYTVT